MLLGCIADDFTGATDLANTLTRRGMHTVQAIGLPKGPAPTADAIVVALKSRTIAPEDAIKQSIAACRWLKSNGAHQIFFKYCSTFDSTDAGNIGPVADALLDELGAGFTIACPAFPENKRTIYLGHLFVGGELLSDSSMRNHPLTPMRDANLVRVLSRQTRHNVGLVPYGIVKRGPMAIAGCFADLQREGTRHAIVDAVEDMDLENIGTACSSLPLVTGGSGVALGLPANFTRAGTLKARKDGHKLQAVGGTSAVLAGSCSPATLAQVATMRATAPALTLDPLKLHADRDTAIAEVMAWATPKLAKGPVLIHSTAEPEAVSEAQAALGSEAAGALVEDAIAAIARALVASGVRRLVVAGGETSGAVVKALGIEALEIGPQISPGVPATLSYGKNRIALALKSGNFGGPDFFAEAIAALK